MPPLSLIFFCVVSLINVGSNGVNGFVLVNPHAPASRSRSTADSTALLLSSSSDDADDSAFAEVETSSDSGKSKLGLITFDLDDTLYPISPVFTEANEAWARTMHAYGYDGIRPNDIAETGRQIREEIAEKNPEAAAAMTFTETRLKAIRRQMESVRSMKCLEDVAKEWATPVSALSPVVVENCKKFATNEVSPSVVQAVYNAWEMERHHSAERNLYPEVIDALKQIKQEHPEVIIGAVTDGRANPLLMTFTLAPYFDFCVNWEDDQGGRSKFFEELSEAENEAQLKWIYEAAKDKYKEIAAARSSLKKKDKGGEDNGTDDMDDMVWIHIGDDLAYDIGGAAACGAKTIFMELAAKYGQTDRLSVLEGKLPEWTMESKAEVEKRKAMNDAAEEQVDARVSFVSRLPEVINDILEADA